MRSALIIIFAFIMVGFTGCSQSSIQLTELKHFPLDNQSEVIGKSGVETDASISSDGNGSLRITTSSKKVVRLFEVDDLDIENAQLIYQAKIRTEDVNGQVYLEMWCQIPGMGEFFSRGVNHPLTGTNDWSTEEIPFFLQKG